MKLFCISLLLILVFITAKLQGSMAIDPETNFNQLVDQYFDEYFKHNPTAATAAGFHQRDAELEDYSQTEVRAQVAMLKDFAAKFEKIRAKSLRPETAIDRELVINNINAALLDLEHVRSWEKNPDRYNSGVANSAYTIMSRSFAPADERLRSLISRERQMPKVFEAARANLKNPPRIFTEVALEQVPGTISFFKNDVPAAFTEVKNEKLLAEFKIANQDVIDALGQYEEFLKKDLLARSTGDFRLGAENFRKKLLYEEMVDIPLDRLLQIGYENLHANQEWFKQTAAKLDPQRTPQQILDDLTKDHPAPDKLLESVRNVLGGIRQFIIDHKIITIPSPVLPTVQDTPSFERALTTASMDTPGPFETKAKEAYYNITPVEPEWTKEHIEEHMSSFNYGTLVSTSIHEAYPGHYVQFLWVQQAPSKIRKLLGCGSNSEGWAHYTEQMMLDEGYGQGDLKLRLGQLQDALLRNARYIVGIQMHTGQMTYEQAIEFFVKEGYQSRAIAEVESKRGTSDPTYLIYTLGKLSILKLREDYRKLRGDKFTLQEFHDGFMKQGFPPIKLIRRAMLGSDSPIL